MREKSPIETIQQYEKDGLIQWVEKLYAAGDEKHAAALGIPVEELRRSIEECKMKSRRDGARQADALIDAGWKFELPEIVNHHLQPNHNWNLHESEPWQWYWRSPAKRKGSKGRKYLSTNQAYRAMCKQAGIEPILPG